jgi:hypothetical protein
MKTSISRLAMACAVIGLVLSPSVLAQRQLGKKKGPTSKLYIAEAVGESQIQNNDKIYTARQATAFDAPGTIIETKANSHNAFVYSNGTGMYIDQNTRVEIDRFVQEPFKPQRNATSEAPLEPSISHSDVFVSRGAVGVCTSQLVSGSSMNYGTPQASVNIRGGKVSIETNANETIVDLLEGDITVRSGSNDVGGQLIRPGERAVIRPGPIGQPPRVTISPIPPAHLQAIDDRVSVACNAKKTVTFEVIERKAEQGLDAPPPETVAASSGDTKSTDSAAAAPATSADAESAGAATDATTQEIVAKPTVPEELPINVVVSPHTLPGK